MNIACLSELTDLEKLGLIIASVFGLILIVVGFVLAFRNEPWRVLGSIKLGKRELAVPGPLAFILLGVVFIGGTIWWLSITFPSDNIRFAQKHWTLGEVKERVERVSILQVELKGEAASFILDKEFSGACATDLMNSICNYYKHLQCDNTEPGVFVIKVVP